MKRLLPILLLTWLALSSLHAQDTSSASEWAKLRYTLHTDVVASTGQHTPFWLVSNRHGRSSLAQGNGQLSVGLFRDFDTSRRFTWAYGAELTAAYHHLAPRYIHQLYADLKYGCWELSLGSKERWSEGKHRTLSGGGLTFAPNARPIPQVRFGITDYAIVPWLFDGWVQVKGHLSYGRYTDKPFLLSHMTDAPRNTHYTLDILFHEKTAFLKIGNESKHPLSVEMGLEMYHCIADCDFLWYWRHLHDQAPRHGRLRAPPHPPHL